MKSAKSGDSQQPSIRRKQSQRRIATDSDEDDTNTQASRAYEEDNFPPQSSNKRSRQIEDDDDAHVDVEADDSQMMVEEDSVMSRPPSSEDEDEPSRTVLSRNPSSSRRIPKPKTSVDSARIKKVAKKPKKSTMYSDEEEDFDEGLREADAIPASGDDNFSPSPPPEKAKGSRIKFGKGPGASKSKGKKEEREITFKDERKLQAKEASAGSKRPRQDIEGLLNPAMDRPMSQSPDPTTTNSMEAALEKDQEPVPKKRKLPTIKKIKNAGSNSSTPGPSKPTTEKDKNASSLPSLPSNLPRKPAATAGNADLDLTNKDVYKQLFSHGNAPPKSGVKEKEARTRELSKMKEEARAKRDEEARTCFDLQEQHDKIAAFTKRLENRKSPSVWPNTLAAKFKAEHEDKARYEGRKRNPDNHQHRQNGWTA